MKEQIFTRIEGFKNRFTDGNSIIKISPLGKNFKRIIKDNIFIGHLKFYNQQNVGLVKINSDNSFWIITYTGDQLFITEYINRQGLELIYLQKELLSCTLL